MTKMSPLTHSTALLATRLIFTDLVLSFLQLRDLEMSHHYEDRSSESTFRDSRSHSQDNPEPPDLPMPTCFRSRSHSYLRAIQAGCSQDDDTASIDSGCSPPLTDTTVRTYSTSTGESPADTQMIHLLQMNLFDVRNHVKWENGRVLTMMQCYVLPN